jgi:hypothetical protein
MQSTFSQIEIQACEVTGILIIGFFHFMKAVIVYKKGRPFGRPIIRQGLVPLPGLT